jgi:glycosyltransferase involved in cell wall biosynthesis
MFDEQIFLLQEYGGISRYFTELIKAFRSNPSLGIDPILSSYALRNNYILNEIDPLALKPVTSSFGAIWHLVLQALFNRRTTNSADLVHLTFYLPSFFERFRQLPKVVTIHDMIPEKMKSPFQLWNPHFVKKSHAVRANLLISVSDSTTSDLKEVYGLTNQIVRTYLGVGPEYRTGLPRREWQPSRYLLFVGNRSGYKDFTVALEAFAKVSHKHPDLFFLLVGGGKINKSESKKISSLNLSSRIIQKNVVSDDLPSVYSNALALVYTTRYEGFGLPLVEAMASGTPVIASRTPINEEIIGECANFFTAGDSSSLSELIDSLNSGYATFQGKIEAGLEKSKEFTWEKCAAETAVAYRKLFETQKEVD